MICIILQHPLPNLQFHNSSHIYVSPNSQTPHSCKTCVIVANYCYYYSSLAESTLILSLVPVAVLGGQNLKDGNLELVICYDQI